MSDSVGGASGTEEGGSGRNAGQPARVNCKSLGCSPWCGACRGGKKVSRPFPRPTPPLCSCSRQPHKTTEASGGTVPWAICRRRLEYRTRARKCSRNHLRPPRGLRGKKEKSAPGFFTAAAGTRGGELRDRSDCNDRPGDARGTAGRLTGIRRSRSRSDEDAVMQQLLLPQPASHAARRAAPPPDAFFPWSWSRRSSRGFRRAAGATDAGRKRAERCSVDDAIQENGNFYRADRGRRAGQS
jgi:hypothetical protein